MRKRITLLSLIIIIGPILFAVSRADAQTGGETAEQALTQGDTAFEKAQYTQALAFYEAALTQAETHRDRKGMAVSLYRMGRAFAKTGRSAQALEVFNKALALHEGLGDKTGMAESLGQLGALHRSLAHYGQALEAYQKLLTLEEAAGNRWAVERCLHALGMIHAALGNYLEALGYHQRSIDIMAELGDQSGVSMGLNNLGAIHGNLGNYPEAISAFQQAMTIGETIGDQSRVAGGLNNMGNVHVMRGDYSQALECYQQALKIRETLGDKDGVAAAYSNMGHVYNTLGDYPQALEYYRNAQQMVEALKDKREIARCWNNMGSVYGNMSQPKRAAEHYQKALTLREELGSKTEVASSLHHLGSVHYNMGDYTKALDYFRRSLRLRETVGDRPGVASSRFHIGATEYRKKNIPAAEREIEAALALSRLIGLPEIQWTALHLKGVIQRASGRTDEAAALLREAVDIIESVRGRVPLAEQKADFLTKRLEVYEQLIDLLAGSKKFAEAFHYAERSRARSFLDLLAEAKGDWRQKISPDLLQRERAVLAKISKLQKSLWEAGVRRESEEVAIALERERLTAQREYSNLKLEIRRRSPDYAGLVYPNPATLEEAQALLDEKTALLEYVLGDERSYLFALTRRRLAVAPLPRREEIERRVKIFSEALAPAPSAESSLAYLDEGTKLYKTLLKPVEDTLRGAQGLIIVPDGALALLPFSALLTRPSSSAGEISFKTLPYLVKQYDIAFVPSASVLSLLDKSPNPPRRKPKELVIFADPIYGEENRRPREPSTIANANPIPPSPAERIGYGYQSGRPLHRIKFSGVEADRLASLYGERATKYLRADATEERVKAETLSDYRYVHFAAHGIVHPDKPEFSAIVLGSEGREDGFLQLPEVFNLRLDAELVVLSACESGLGKAMRGEGLLGLARGFMYVGARAVLASLWKIEDSPATVDWMYTFYRKLDEGGKAQALRMTQLDFINSQKYNHPFYWAAFALIGKNDSAQRGENPVVRE